MGRETLEISFWTAVFILSLVILVYLPSPSRDLTPFLVLNITSEGTPIQLNHSLREYIPGNFSTVTWLTFGNKTGDAFRIIYQFRQNTPEHKIMLYENGSFYIVFRDDLNNLSVVTYDAPLIYDHQPHVLVITSESLNNSLNVTFYIDAIAISSSLLPASTSIFPDSCLHTDTSSCLIAGGSIGMWDHNFDGVIHRFQLYNTTLSLQEIRRFPQYLYDPE